MVHSSSGCIGQWLNLQRKGANAPCNKNPIPTLSRCSKLTTQSEGRHCPARPKSTLCRNLTAAVGRGRTRREVEFRNDWKMKVVVVVQNEAEFSIRAEEPKLTRRQGN